MVLATLQGLAECSPGLRQAVTERAPRHLLHTWLNLHLGPYLQSPQYLLYLMQIIGPLLIGTPHLAGGIVGVDTDGLLLGGLQGHDSEIWSREWQLEHQPSVLLAIPLKHSACMLASTRDQSTLPDSAAS